ncbi:hypothetical protein HXX76_002538 [Chlamydomonas incerta]|uniref:ATP-dependent RNA helicase n=1 Tax=Chlamydomonas incerta TaxID=51695 RepID=A0A835W6K2_CHLIN|nr:hypothetical protein HXX76_002538 [Chlamydomonas incerta]|eukprot:KAG2442452.1 hypothetical protein HXX76_002538 [Chlamydomonas incerta]
MEDGDDFVINTWEPSSVPKKAPASAKKDGGGKPGNAGGGNSNGGDSHAANGNRSHGGQQQQQRNGKPFGRDGPSGNRGDGGSGGQGQQRNGGGGAGRQEGGARGAGGGGGGGGGGAAAGGGGGGRQRQQPGKDRFKTRAGGRAMDPDDPDELLRSEAPAEEQDDLAEVLGLVAAREQALQAEAEGAAGAAGGGGKRRAPAAEPEGVVDFDDDDGGRKRRRTDGPAKPAIKATGRGNFTPGTAIHAGANPAAAAAAAADGAAGTDATWQGLGLAPSLSGQLESLGFAAPTPIQKLVLPVLLSGRDALVKAQTGSGKTLCYLLPIINDLQAQEPRISRGEGTYAIVLAPTRELSIQVADVANAVLKRYHWLVSGLLIGGENRAHEKARLRKGVSLLAASPGRLLDHLQSTASFRTTELRWLVLDEADRLLDLGFEAKLRQITELLNRRSAAGMEAEAAGGAAARASAAADDHAGDAHDADGDFDFVAEEKSRRRQAAAAAGPGPGSSAAAGASQRRTVLVSATLHKQLGALAELALQDPAVVGFDVQQTTSGPKLLGGADVGSGAGDATADGDGVSYSLPASLRQTWLEVPAKERLSALAALLKSRTARRRPGGTKIVVFVSSCDGVEFHHHLLADMWEAVAGGPLLPRTCRLFKLHGDMPQSQRTETFAGFSKEGDGVLLCTDVAARGLDFPNVTTIIQYDVPGAPAEYVHRVGRSARMGAAGEAVMVLMPHEVPYVNLLRSRGVMLEALGWDGLTRFMPTPTFDPEGGGGGGGGKISKKMAAAAEGLGSAGAARQLAAQLHRQLSGAVARDPHAAQLASDAFRSYVRAYATHSGDLKRVFAVRNLHLGHVAHAFCLTETPTLVGSSGSAADRKRRKREQSAAAEADRRKKMKRAARQAAA